MTKKTQIISIAFTVFVLYLGLVFGFILALLVDKFQYRDLNLIQNEYLQDEKYILINSSTSINYDRYPEPYYPGYAYCAVDGIKEENDTEYINIEKYHRDGLQYQIDYITDNFKTINMKYLYLDNVLIYTDNIEKNNPSLQKIFFTSEDQLTGRVLSTINHNKLYLLDKECINYDGKIFNLSKIDHSYLYPNIIIKYGNNYFWSDADGEALTILNWSGGLGTKRLYTDQKCSVLFDLNTIINKDIDTNADGDIIYTYHPIVLYMKS